MGRARRWASVALAGLIAACLSAAVPGPAGAAQEVLDWKVSGEIDVGGMYSFGERGSSKFNEYRDMDNGFVGDLSLRGEKKDQPYFFDLRAKNPAKDDQAYGGALGRYGMFQLELGWDRTPHVLSNSAKSIYQENNDTFNLPPTLWPTIASTLSPTAPATSITNIADIASTINGLARSVDLRFNTDVGKVGFKYTPLEDFRVDAEYMNIRREGHRPLVGIIASPGGSPNELAVPIENYTHEVKFGAEYAKPDYALQFNYTGSIFANQYTGYSWDNPLTTTDSATRTNGDRISAPPNNSAHTFNLTGTATLPLRTRINGSFAYTMLRQDQAFELTTQNPALTQRNTDDLGKSSPDAQANLVSANIVLTSRPINSVTATARYRYFDFQNDTPIHTFTNVIYPTGTGPAQTGQPDKERYTKQNAGFDLGWRPISVVSLKGGYEYEHWNRGDFEGQTFSNSEHIGKFSADVTPVDWFLGRVTYTYGDRTVDGFNIDLTGMLPQSIKYNYADRIRNRVDALLQFSPWETLTPSVSVGYAKDDYHNNQFGLLKNDYLTAGINLDWSPLKWLTFSTDYTYEQYNYEMASRYLVGGVFPGFSYNDWKSKSKDEFHNVGVNAVVDIVPKKFDVTLGYGVSFGYTTFKNTNPNLNVGGVTVVPSATAYYWDKVFNVLQTFKIVAKYRLTEKLSLRGGFAYERYTEKDFARDPMQPFMGYYGTDRPGGALLGPEIQSVYLGATQPSYESYIFSGFVRYEF